MAQKVNIIGAGVAGLCTASFLQQKGFETEIFEAHKRAGGLMTYWNRGDYRIETCIHWMIGSHKESTFYPFWNQVLDMDKLEFFDHEVFNSFEDKNGNCIRFFTNTDKLEVELLAKAPEDSAEIKAFIKAIRTISKFKMPLDYGDNRLNLISGFKFFMDNFSLFGEFQKWTKITETQFAAKLKNPILKNAIEYLFMPDMAMIFIIYSLAWMNKKHAGYPIGGSFKVSKLMEEKLLELGGKISYKSVVKKILVENNKTIGLELEDGSQYLSDFVVSAADGMQTFNTFLGGNYNQDKIFKRFSDLKVFPSYLQVTLGVRKNLDEFYPSFSFQLENKFKVDATTDLKEIAVRLFPYDKTFYPEGCGIIQVFIPSYNFDYWNDLRNNENEKYKEEKLRVLESIVDLLETRMGNLREFIEMTDISSPATVFRYTRNYKGSMEGWQMTPNEGFSTLPIQIKGLKNLYLAGQWISPGGGLPAGLITGLEVSKAIQKQAKKK